jgi:hypothetical protein
MLARLMVWLTRRILWALMWIGHLVSSLMLRQMEFDADRYEARVAGSDTFEATSERLAMLTVARNAAFHDLGSAWREKRLCDDLSKLIVSREIEMPPDVRGKVQKHHTETKTGWFDSHPCTADRIASAQQEKSPGIFQIEGPATVLFHDFDKLSQTATEMFYRENLGNAFSPKHMVTTDSMVSQRGERKQAFESLQRFCQGLVNPIRPTFPERGTYVPKSRDAAAEMLLHARTRLMEAAPAAREAAKRFDMTDETLLNIVRMRAALEAGVPANKMKMEGLGLAGTCNHATLGARTRELELARSRAAEEIGQAVGGATVRINIALDFTKQEQPTRQTTGDSETEYELVAEAAAGSGDRIFDAITTLRTTAGRIERIRQEYSALGVLLSLCKPENNPESLVRLVIQKAKQLHEQLTQTHNILRGTPYPYEHAERGASISRYALERLQPAENVVGVYRAAESTLEAIYSLYMRLMSDLAHRAEELEQSLGLPPLPEIKGE